MRILYHHRTLAEDAQGIHIAEMVRAFRNLGHEVKVVSLVKQGGKEQRGEVSRLGRAKEKIPPFVYELMEMGYSVAGLAALLAEVVRFKPDFIYERYALYNAAGVLAGALAGIPVIEEVNAPLVREKIEHGRLSFPRIAGWVERKICCAATRVIAVSGPMKRIFVEQGVPEEKLVVMHNGVREELLAEPTRDDTVRHRLGIPREALVFGFVGWFRPWHGLDRLIRVFHDHGLPATGARLLLVGGGPVLEDLKRQAGALGLLDRGVHFSGPVPHEAVRDHVRAMDVALQPDVTPYASPMKIFEYLGLGKPVIAPDLENIREILTQGVDAWLFDPGDQDDLARIILRLVDASDEISEHGRRARETIGRRKFLWTENASRTLRLL